MPSKQNIKLPNKTSGGNTSQRTWQSSTPEERQAASDRRFKLIQEALRAPPPPPSGLPVITASSLTCPTLRYRSQAIQTSPSVARTIANVIKTSTTTVVVSSESEDECHGEALAITGNGTRHSILDRSGVTNGSVHGGLTPAEHPRRVVVILDSDDEVFTPYPDAGSPRPDQQSQSQDSVNPFPPGQRPRPRTPSPSPSWEYVPMPGAFPATPYGTDTTTLPNGSFPDDYETMGWNSSPVQPVVEIKAEEDEIDFYL